MNVKILNITFSTKPYCIKEHFFPISAGTHRNDIVSDDIGDNISERNKRFGELTAVYWAWKNLKGVDIIGMSHYRRYMMHTSWLKKTHYECSWSYFVKSPYSIDPFIKDLRTHDIIFCKRWHFEGITVREQFLQHHPFPEVLDLARVVLSMYHPEALSVWDQYLSASDGYCCCMFIAKWNVFDNLCKWMFPMLFELEKRIDFSKYDSYQQRMIAFLYERFLNVYLVAMNMNIKEYPFLFIDEHCNKSILRQEIGARLWNLYLKIRKHI